MLNEVLAAKIWLKPNITILDTKVTKDDACLGKTSGFDDGNVDLSSVPCGS
jgi:hypothetical protein